MAQNSNNKDSKNGFWSRFLRKPIISSLLALFGVTAFMNIAKPSLSSNSFSLPEAQLENTDNKEYPYKGYSKDNEDLNILFALLNSNKPYINDMKFLNKYLWEHSREPYDGFFRDVGALNRTLLLGKKNPGNATDDALKATAKVLVDYLNYLPCTSPKDLSDIHTTPTNFCKDRIKLSKNGLNYDPNTYKNALAGLKAITSLNAEQSATDDSRLKEEPYIGFPDDIKRLRFIAVDPNSDDYTIDSALATIDFLIDYLENSKMYSSPEIYVSESTKFWGHYKEDPEKEIVEYASENIEKLQNGFNGYQTIHQIPVPEFDTTAIDGTKKYPSSYRFRADYKSASVPPHIASTNADTQMPTDDKLPNSKSR